MATRDEELANEARAGEPGPCDGCGSPGEWCRDPFVHEIYGDAVWGFWCDQCYSERVDDI